VVGGGTFAVKISTVLTKHNISHAFVDEFVHGELLGLPVYRAAAIPDPDRLCIIAISDPTYSQAACERLAAQGVQQGCMLPLLYESQSNLFAHALSHCFDKVFAYIEQHPADNMIDIDALLTNVFDHAPLPIGAPNQLPATSAAPSLTKIAFCYIGQGGGFRSHVCDLPAQLSQQYTVAEFSDHVIEQQTPHHRFMSEAAMLECDWADLVINPHFFACSPAHTPKLTTMHMLYDFLVHRDLVARVMAQPEHHYMFMPSQASLDLHLQICRDYDLRNQITFIPGGYPKLDQSIARYDALHQALHTQQDQTGLPSTNTSTSTIIYAPTLSALVETDETAFTYSIVHAQEFIPAILAAFPDKNVIFRPHPDDMIVISQNIHTERATAFRQLLALCETHPRCHLDTNKFDYLASFAKASLLISDTSGIAYTFAAITMKPVLFFVPDNDAVEELFPHVKYIQDRKHIGHCVGSTAELLAAISRLDNTADDALNDKRAFCQQLVFHRGRAKNVFTDTVARILHNEPHPDWITHYT
jgi:hypothetical protein